MLHITIEWQYEYKTLYNVIRWWGINQYLGNKYIGMRFPTYFELYIILMVHVALEIEYFYIYYIETIAEQTTSEYRFN